MKVERTVRLSAAPKDVYDVVMDPARLEDWVTIHDHLVGDPPSPLKKGSRLTQCLRLAGKRFKVRWTVVENDPCRKVVWEGRGPVMSHAQVEYRFEPDGDGTRFSYVNQYDLPGGPLGRIAGRTVSRVTTREVDGSLQKLKALVD
jgi:carbon monoxide dehydrogenase subunit G